MSDSFPWAIVVVGGPIVLGLVLAWTVVRTARANKRADPGTPSDDPSQGMTGHDVPDQARLQEVHEPPHPRDP